MIREEIEFNSKETKETPKIHCFKGGHCFHAPDPITCDCGEKPYGEQKPWEERFDETWNAIKGTLMAENIKSFVSTLLAQQKTAMKQEISYLIAEEINTARTDGFPTSRLTSLAVKINNIIKVLE